MNRRSFMQSMLATAGAASMSSFAIGKPGTAANSKLNIAMIGVGGVAKWNYGWAQSKNLVAMCDVDSTHSAEGFKRFVSVPKFTDYRRMLDKMGKDIDGVLISTPDHIHFPASMAAMERGIHVWVQKPASHDIWQARTMLKGAQKYRVVTQMGNQGHISEGIRMMKEWYDAGVLGEVREVIAWTNRRSSAVHNPLHLNPNPPEVIPDTLDWDRWLGPAKHHAYSKSYAPGNWRWYFDFGSGALGDIGCHTLDTPFWAMDLPMPTKVEVEFQKNKTGNRPDSIVTYHFPARGNKPPVTIKWYEGLSKAPVDYLPAPKTQAESEGGLIMVGSKHTAYHYNMRPNNPKILMADDDWRDFRKTLPAKTIPRIKGISMDDWARGITDGVKPCSSFEISTKLTEMILLGVVAQRAGHTIGWDEKSMSVPGHPELAPLIKQPIREEWSYGEGLWV